MMTWRPRATRPIPLDSRAKTLVHVSLRALSCLTPVMVVDEAAKPGQACGDFSRVCSAGARSSGGPAVAAAVRIFDPPVVAMRPCLRLLLPALAFLPESPVLRLPLQRALVPTHFASSTPAICLRQHSLQWFSVDTAWCAPPSLSESASRVRVFDRVKR